MPGVLLPSGIGRRREVFQGGMKPEVTGSSHDVTRVELSREGEVKPLSLVSGAAYRTRSDLPCRELLDDLRLRCGRRPALVECRMAHIRVWPRIRPVEATVPGSGFSRRRQTIFEKGSGLMGSYNVAPIFSNAGVEYTAYSTRDLGIRIDQ